MSKYLRNQCKKKHCDITLQLLCVHLQAEKKKKNL